MSRYDADELDRIRDWAASRCDGPTTLRQAIRLWETRTQRADRPSPRERRAHRADHLANKDARAVRAAGRLTQRRNAS